MVRERQRLSDYPKDVLNVPLVINLPGVGGRQYAIPDALFHVGAAVHHRADLVRAALTPTVGSVWELVELEELLVLFNGLCGDTGETQLLADLTQPSSIYMRGRTGLLTSPKMTGTELVVFIAFTLHYHADAISRLVIPHLDIAVAVEMAEALVVAEQLVWLVTERGHASPGTFEKPTALQAQLWKLTARLWQEWPRDREFNLELTTPPAAPSYLERMQGAGPEVAA